MIENLSLESAPNESGCYLFLDEADNVIYVGSSSNLFRRMQKHKQSIRVGHNNGSQKDLYNFLQNNYFTVRYCLSVNYNQKEQELIERLNPVFNKRRAYTAFRHIKGNEYYKKWHSQYREQHLNQMIEYCSRLCLYEDEILNFNQLRTKFKKMGIQYPCKEARKYLIE